MPGVSIVLVLEGTGTLEEFAEDGTLAGGSGLRHSVESGAIFVMCADTFLHLTASDEPFMLFRASERFEEAL